MDRKHISKVFRLHPSVTITQVSDILQASRVPYGATIVTLPRAGRESDLDPALYVHASVWADTSTGDLDTLALASNEVVDYSAKVSSYYHHKYRKEKK